MSPESNASIEPMPHVKQRVARAHAPRFAALVLTGCGLAGCLPLSNTHYFAPATAGTVTRHGVPVAHAEVTVSSWFNSARISVRTDSLGRFATEAIKEARLTMVVLGDPLYDYTVEIAVAGQTYLGIHDVRIGDAPRYVVLNCELERSAAVPSAPAHCSQTD